MGTIELVSRHNEYSFKIRCTKCARVFEHKMLATRDGCIICPECGKKL